MTFYLIVFTISSFEFHQVELLWLHRQWWEASSIKIEPPAAQLWQQIDFFYVFKMAAKESEIWWWHSFGKIEVYLRRLPNFDEICQSTAEIKLLSVSENGRPPYWNSTAGFDFDLCVGMSCYISAGKGIRGATQKRRGVESIENEEGFPNWLWSLRSVVSSPSGVRSGAWPKTDFSAFRASELENASRWDVCRKLTSFQKTFVNGYTIAFNRLAALQSTRWFGVRRELPLE